MFPEVPCHLFHIVLGTVAVPGLVISQCPEGRQFHCSGECGISLYDISNLRSGEEVVIQFFACRLEHILAGGVLAHIKDALPRAVKEHAVGLASVKSNEKRNRDVKRVGGRSMVNSVSIPQCHGCSALIKIACSFPKSVKPGAGWENLKARCAVFCPTHP